MVAYKNFKNIKAIAFDFWGVFAKINAPMNEYLKAQGVKVERYADEIHDLIIKHDLGELTEKQFLAGCSKITGIKIPYPLCRYTYKEGTLNYSLVNIIKLLKIKYTIALLSNNNKEYCEEYLFKPGLDKLFDVMVISYQVGYRKPSSEIYKILIEKLRVKPGEILFLDDQPEKLPPAEAQGICTMLYEGEKTNKLLRELV